MNQDEEIINNHLISRGFLDIIPEPDENEPPKGKKPPDFLVNSEIAIEVTRLTKIDDNNEGLETLYYSIFDKMKNILNAKEFKNDMCNESAWVEVCFFRPLCLSQDWKEIKKKIKKILLDHISKLKNGEIEYSVCENLSLIIKPTTKIDDKIYLLEAPSDLDQCGYVISEIYKSLFNKIIPEKTEKIKNYKSKYKTW